LRHVKEPCDYTEVGSQAKLIRPFLARSAFLTNRGLCACVAWSASGVDGRN
jgi:hypothetical protein